MEASYKAGTDSFIAYGPQEVKKAYASSNAVINKILILIHGDDAADSELPLIKTPLDNWGYSTEVFDGSDNYDLVQSGDHWYLHDTGGGHGDLDLVTDGIMQYSTIIFGASSGVAYTDVETSARLVKQMFQSYPFLGIVRQESGYCLNSTNNVFGIGINGSANHNTLTISNPTGNIALEPLIGYTKSFTGSASYNITMVSSNVTNLEVFDAGNPAITMANYISGAKAIYFAFKDWGYAQHVSILVRLIQEYSGLPYKKPYYSYEVDDGGVSTVNNADYTNLAAWTYANLGGYPTLSFMGHCLDQSPPAGIGAFGQNPTRYRNIKNTNPNLPALITILKTYPEYVIAAHGYRHDRDLWKYTATGLPVNGFADDDSDGTLNWLDDTMEGGTTNNNLNSNLTQFSGAEFADYDLVQQEVYLARLRAVFDLYGLDIYRVLITPKFVHLDGYSNTLFSKYGFNIISGSASASGYTMTAGWLNGTYMPIRVAPSNAPTDPDTALTAPQLLTYKNNFFTYIGSRPLILVTSHLPQMQEGTTSGYEARDSVLPAYQIMNTAGYKLLTTQSATNKNIGWLWTTLSSSKDTSGDYQITFTSAAFADSAAKHELDIVMPASIKSVKLGSNYWINVNGADLYFGKNSNTTEVLQVESGTYNTTIPRIISISTPATDVLDATYNPATEEISLTLSGDFATDISIANLKISTNYRLTDLTTGVIGNYLSDGSGNIIISVTLGGKHDYKITETRG
jgi:hypothetical protein